MPWLCNYSEAILNNFLKGLEEMNNTNEQKTYVCKRARMCSFLIEKGFTPYKVAPTGTIPCTMSFFSPRPPSCTRL